MSDYLLINNKKHNTKIALTTKEKEKGLMFVDKISEAMSFPFEKPDLNYFWMHNTKIALDIVFCNNGKIVDICDGRPYSLDFVGPNCDTNLVAEFPRGYCKENNIKIGDSIKLKYSKDSICRMFNEKFGSEIAKMS